MTTDAAGVAGQRLHSMTVGESGTRVAFLHGLFGQGRNWTQVAKALAEGPDGHRVTLLDLPNHGRSPWTETFSYLDMADSVAKELRAVGGDERWAVVGHSMGGKTAMLLALRHPDLVERLVVADISPVNYTGLREFSGFIDGMRALDLANLPDRASADAALTEAVRSPSVRAFLLQNLRRDGQSWKWQLNLDLLADSLGLLGDWPDAAGLEPFQRPTLWLAGANSVYVQPEYAEAMRELFPRVQLVTIKDAGHWLHSEQPEVFITIVRRFLGAASR